MPIGVPASRRQFLIALSAVAANCQAASAAEVLLSAPSLEERLRLELSARTTAARTIGLAHRSDLGGGASTEALLRELAGRVGPFCKNSQPLRRSDLAGAIEKAVRQDFAQGDMCAAGGWLLSRTEALMCAIAAS